MRKLFLVLLCGTCVLAVTAQSVKTSTLSASYSATPTVTFNVSWTENSRGNKSNGKIYNSKIWVFVDYQSVADDGTKGEWTRAEIVTASASVGSVSYDVSPRQGFWLDGSSVGTAAFTSKVTVTLNVSGKFNWCAYATDHAPNAANYAGGVYTLKGTQPFYINGSNVPTNSNKYTGTINTITDATKCPGCIGRDAPKGSGVCCTGLVFLNGYCRNLVADGAKASVACNREWKIGYGIATCGSLWSWADETQLTCIYRNEKLHGTVVAASTKKSGCCSWNNPCLNKTDGVFYITGSKYGACSSCAQYYGQLDGYEVHRVCYGSYSDSQFPIMCVR